MSINDLEDRMMAKIVMICRDGFKNSVNILSLILDTLIHTMSTVVCAN